MKELPDNIRDIVKGASYVSLSESEKETMLQSVLASAKLGKKSQPSGWQLFDFWSFQPAPFLKTATAVFLVLVIGTTSVAAERSGPGDILYPVKTEVNERFVGVLHIGDEAGARYQVGLVERRLQEMSRVSLEGRLSPDIIDDLSGRIEVHMDRASQSIKRLEEGGKTTLATSVVSDMESALGVYSLVFSESPDEESVRLSYGLLGKIEKVSHDLVELETRIAEEDFDLEDIKNLTEKALKNAETALASAETAVALTVKETVEALPTSSLPVATSTPDLESATSSVAVVAATSTDSESLMFDQKEGSAPAERIDQAKKLIAEGFSHLEQEQFNRAFVSFLRAQRAANSARRMVEFGVSGEVSRPDSGKIDAAEDVADEILDDTLRPSFEDVDNNDPLIDGFATSSSDVF